MLFIYCLFNATVSISDYTASNDRMIGKMLKEAIMTYLEHLPGGSEEDREKSEPTCSVILM
jgi:hypothetical protein